MNHTGKYSDAWRSWDDFWSNICDLTLRFARLVGECLLPKVDPDITGRAADLDGKAILRGRYKLRIEGGKSSGRRFRGMLYAQDYLEAGNIEKQHSIDNCSQVWSATVKQGYQKLRYQSDKPNITPRENMKATQCRVRLSTGPIRFRTLISLYGG